MKTGRLAALVALSVFAIVPSLLAVPPGAGSTASEGPRRGKPAGLPSAMTLPSGTKLPLPSAFPLPSGFPRPAGSDEPPALPPRASASPSHDELARRWRVLAESRHQRRERHRAALVRELGQRLSDPQIKAELELHATRVAELSRLRFLAENSRSGSAREQLLARIEKLSAREDSRHKGRMAALLAARPLPSARPAPAPSSSAGGRP